MNSKSKIYSWTGTSFLKVLISKGILVSLFIPNILFAEALYLDVEDLVAVLSESDIEGDDVNDWNEDGYVDLAVMAISEDRDSIDLHLGTSNPDTGEIFFDTVSDVFPYNANEPNTYSYGLGPFSFDPDSGRPERTYDLAISYTNNATGLSLSLSIDIKPKNVIYVARAWLGNQVDEHKEVTCRLDYIRNERGINSHIYGYIKIGSAGPEPLIQEWNTDVFPKICFD